MNKKVSLVLSGGGARGIAHIGVIEELEAEGFEIFAIAGTSMGALVGGVYALGKMEEYKKWLFTLDRIKTFNLVDFTLSGQGLIKGDRVLNRMKDFIPDSKIEDLAISYTAVAADIINNEEVTFTKGSIYDAIRASISIPTVLTPVKTKNGLLVDGGVLNNIPINHAKRADDDLLIAVDVNANVPVLKTSISRQEKEEKESIYRKKLNEFYTQLQKINPLSREEEESERIGYFELINRTLGLMTYHMTQQSLEHYPPDLLVQISHNACGTFDFFRAEELVEMGKTAARKSIRKFQDEGVS